MRKEQAAAFWAVIEGKNNKSPRLRKAASFSAYPASPSLLPDIERSTGSRTSQLTAATREDIPSPSLAVPQPPRLRKTASCPANLPQASSSRLPPPAATASPLALWSHSNGRRHLASTKALPLGPLTTMGAATATFTSFVTTAAASDTLHQVARAASINASPQRTAVNPSASLAVGPQLSLTMPPTLSIVSRRPSASSLRPPSARATSHAFRRQLSFDSVATCPSSDHFELDFESALGTEKQLVDSSLARISK